MTFGADDSDLEIPAALLALLAFGGMVALMYLVAMFNIRLGPFG